MGRSASATSATTQRVGMVGDAVEFLAGLHALAVDDLLLDHVSGRRCRPIERAGIAAFLARLADATLRDREIAQPLHGALEISTSVGGRDTAPALGRAHGDKQIDLRALNVW